MEVSRKLSEFSQLEPEQLLAKGLSILPAVVTTVLVALAAWQLARLAWVFAPYPDPEVGAIRTLGTAPREGAEGQVSEADMNRVAEAHLFGEAAVEAPPVVVQETLDAPDTNLSLELLGTLAADRKEESYALIHERGKETKVYAIGEAVTADAKLHAVYADRVLLERRGKLEALRLPRELTGSAPRSPSTVSRTRTSQAELSNPSMAAMITENASSFTDIVRPQPVFADGQQRGYRLYPGRERRKFAMLGLRPGDLVTEINGTALTDPSKGMEIFQGLGEATSVTVTVERNGQPEVLVLDTSQLSQLQQEE